MISGSLKSVPLGDVFQLVAMSQKSGILTVIRGAHRARVYFSHGQVAYAHMSSGAHLGEILVRLDLVTAHEVQEILMQQKRESPGTLLGRVAVERGILSEEDLARAVEAQAFEVVTELLTWNDGGFEFDAATPAASQVPLGQGLDAGLLLMRALGSIEEYKEHSVPPQAVFSRSGDPTLVQLPPGGWEVLGHVDGRRSARAIAAELDLAARQVYAILGALEQAGVVERSPYPADEPLVLVKSGSPALQRLIELALLRSGFRTVHVVDLEAVFPAIAEHHPRAMVLDDDGGAWELLRELRKNPAQGHLPVLVLVEKEPQGTLFRPLPKADWLRKPFHELELQQVVGRLVGTARAT